MSTRNDEKTELEKEIYIDIQSEIQKYYDCEKIEYKESEKPEDTIMDFFSYLSKLIFPVPRKVHYSNELLKRINLNEISKDHIDILKKYEEAFSIGKNMNFFLSTKVNKLRKTDFLLYTWHLYHLHMSGKFVEEKEQMKNNRSDTQLLCIVEQEDVYFIDVISHPKKAEDYFNIGILKIIAQNGWMDKIGFYEISNMIPGSLEPKITEGQNIFKLFSEQSVNIAFEFQGKGYLSPFQMNSKREPVEVSYELIKIRKEVCKLNNIEGEYKGFRLAQNAQGFLCGIVEFEMPTGKIKLINIFK